MKKIVKLTGLMLIVLLAACEKNFDNINKDPNGITDVPADFLLPGAIMSLASAENAYMESFAYASDWVQYTSCGFWADPGRYNFEKSRSFLWDNLYSGPMLDLKLMNRKAATEGNQSLRAVSLILYSYGFTLLTDCYGMIPFSQALSAEEGLNKPQYDSQETVYRALLDSLATANHLLKGMTRITVKTGYDVLCNGEALKWQKFANALRVRMLVRISNKTDVSAQLQQLVNDPDSPLPASNLDNISFIYPGTTPRNYHPLFDVLSTEASDGGYRLSKTLTDHLIASGDPRIAVYALKNSAGNYAGLPSGLGASAGQIDEYSRVNPRYGQKDRAGIFISYSELQFLLAEAVNRSLITGDAKSFYENAIRANFSDLGIAAEEFNTFISSVAGRYTNLERILTQKWVSMFGRGIEGWTEFRRTGQPSLVPAAYAFVNVVPQRFLYPLTEEQTNKENMVRAIEQLPNGDALNSSVWWMK
ncbi:MAG: SusD/RagB family nutrient-binding outer membrane lipoprotein [Bacteroidales bacterium]